MFILFVLQLALVIWAFVQYNEFLNAMNDAVNMAWEKNDDANGYPMNSLQIGVSTSINFFIFAFSIKYHYFYINLVQMLWPYWLYGL